jgi:acetolactate synthase-1/3 small subunit
MLNRTFSSFSRALSAGAFRRRKPRLPIIATNITPQTAQEAVDNILYNSPSKDITPAKRHTLNCLVANEPGVLSRVSGILAGRGINIDSLVVARTEVSDLSRMTIVINGQDEKIEQARKQLEDIVPVWAVLDYSGQPTVQREMLLVKVATVPHEFESDDSLQHDTDVCIVYLGSPLRHVHIAVVFPPEAIDHRVGKIVQGANC